MDKRIIRSNFLHNVNQHGEGVRTMRRIPMIHRIISFGLALALFALSPASAFADGEEDIALVGTASIENCSKEA